MQSLVNQGSTDDLGRDPNFFCKLEERNFLKFSTEFEHCPQINFVNSFFENMLELEARDKLTEILKSCYLA